MKPVRRIPPAAPRIRYMSLLHGLGGLLKGRACLAGLRKEIGDFFEVRHVYLVGSGKAALVLALQALSRLVPGKNEVLVPAYTCYSVPSAVSRAGLRISACDIDESTYDFVHEKLESSINDRTLCVVPTHLFGIPADVKRVMDICRRRNIFVVEDAAQAMGWRFKGRHLGTAGDVGFFSLGRGKNISCGGGGVILTNSDAIARELDRTFESLESPKALDDLAEYVKIVLMYLFISPQLYWIPSRLPFLGLGETVFSTAFPVEKLSGMKAGLLREWRRQLEEGNRIRVENAEYYRRNLGDSAERLPSAPYLRFPYIADSGEHRERLLRAGAELGLGFSPMYPLPVSEIAEIRSQFDGADYPSAKRISERIVTLPTHEFVSRRDREAIRRAIEGSRAVA